jgi:hypothetical protein
MSLVRWRESVRRRRQAVTTVCRSLQRREIEQQGRRLAHALLPQPLDQGTLRPARRELPAGHDALRQIALCQARDDRFALRRHDAPGGGHLQGSLGGRAHRHEQAARLPVVTRLELPDLQLPPHEDRQRGRLDAADRIERRIRLSARAHRDGAGGVHADEPVGLRATARGAGERVELAAGTQTREARPDRLVGEGRDPQALDRKATARQLVDVTKDELALSSGVAGVHDFGEAPVA